VKAHKKVPRVEGAMTRWPSTRLVAPQRSRAASSMQSAPASIAWTRVNSFAPRMGGAGPLAQVDQRIGGLLDAQPLGQRGGSSGPALAIAWVSSKRVSSWSRVWEDAIENLPS
jgi:hypothetical protein